MNIEIYLINHLRNWPAIIIELSDNMVSIKNMINCLEYYSQPSDVTPTLSIIKHFYGLLTTTPVRLSLLKQVQLIRGRHVHLNIFLVATPHSKYSEITAAIQRARDIYAQVNFGIARILYFDISKDESRGRENLNNDAEAKALTHEHRAIVSLHGAIDVFLFLVGELLKDSGYLRAGQTTLEGLVIKMTHVS